MTNWDKAAQAFRQMLDTRGEEIVKMADGTQYMDELAQASVDLEPIRKLIEVATDCEPVPVAGTAMMGCPQGKLVGCVDAAREALPALKSLLAEVERLRAKNAKMKESSDAK